MAQRKLDELNTNGSSQYISDEMFNPDSVKEKEEWENQSDD